MARIQCADNVLVCAPRALIDSSATLRRLCEDLTSADEPIPLCFDSELVRCIAHYCETRRLREADDAKLARIIHAADHLDIESLKQLASLRMGAIIEQAATPADACRTLGLTPHATASPSSSSSRKRAKR